MIRIGVILMTIGLFFTGCASQRGASVQRPSLAGQRVYFNFARSDIRPSEREKLGAVANILKSDRKAAVLLEGHTDKVGPSRYNEILAENRARAVRAYLWTLGADPSRMTMISKGEREPIAKGSTRKDHQQNRRVELWMTLTSTKSGRKP